MSVMSLVTRQKGLLAFPTQGAVSLQFPVGSKYSFLGVGGRKADRTWGRTLPSLCTCAFKTAIPGQELHGLLRSTHPLQPASLGSASFYLPTSTGADAEGPAVNAHVAQGTHTAVPIK